MKILYVLNNNMQYAGTESVVLSYFKYLQSEKIHIDFILHTTEEESNNNEICRYLRQSGSKIHCVIPRKVSLKQNIKDIQNILRREHYDIIHSHADCISGLILQIAKDTAQKLCQSPKCTDAALKLLVQLLTECRLSKLSRSNY